MTDASPTTKNPRSRPNAGRKSANKVPGESKTVRANVRMYPHQAAYLAMVFGSAQAALDSIAVPPKDTVI